MIMSSIQKITDKSTQTQFEKKVLSAIKHLHPYVKHRLYIAESLGILPKNMYTSTGIIDEGILHLYENGYDIDAEAMAVKLNLFKIIDKDLDQLFKNEGFHQKTMSTHSILIDELDGLNEDYTIDADLDLILKTELNDISYQQDTTEHLFLYNDQDTTILKAFEMEDLTSKNTKKLFGKFYSWLPMNVSNIVDMYAFGKLNFDEIAKIKQIETNRIKRIFNIVRHSFRNASD
jgi:hypothetical protein